MATFIDESVFGGGQFFTEFQNTSFVDLKGSTIAVVNPAINDRDIQLASVANTPTPLTGHLLEVVINRGKAKEEFQFYRDVVGSTLKLTAPLVQDHNVGDSVELLNRALVMDGIGGKLATVDDASNDITNLSDVSVEADVVLPSATGQDKELLYLLARHDGVSKFYAASLESVSANNGLKIRLYYYDGTSFNLLGSYNAPLVDEFKVGIRYVVRFQVFGDVLEVFWKASGLVAPTGSITTVPAAQLVGAGVAPAAETVTLYDGNSQAVFEFDDSGLLANGALGDGVSALATNYVVDISASVTNDDVKLQLIAAINAVTSLSITASDGGVGVVTLTHDVLGILGNTVAGQNRTTVADPGFVVTDMTGGLNFDLVWAASDSRLADPDTQLLSGMAGFGYGLQGGALNDRVLIDNLRIDDEQLP